MMGVEVTGVIKGRRMCIYSINVAAYAAEVVRLPRQAIVAAYPAVGRTGAAAGNHQGHVAVASALVAVDAGEAAACNHPVAGAARTAVVAVVDTAIAVARTVAGARTAVAVRRTGPWHWPVRTRNLRVRSAGAARHSRAAHWDQDRTAPVAARAVATAEPEGAHNQPAAGLPGAGAVAAIEGRR